MDDLSVKGSVGEALLALMAEIEKGADILGIDHPICIRMRELKIAIHADETGPHEAMLSRLRNANRL